MAIPPAPSAPPTSVSVSEVTSSSITVQWGPVDCIDRNGDITGYSLQYLEAGSEFIKNLSVSGGSVTEATISNNKPLATYNIELAAVNSAGIGHPLKFNITIEIPKSEYYMHTPITSLNV